MGLGTRRGRAMTGFIIEFAVVCALVCGFMATHSLAAAIVSAAPVIAAMVWLRSLQADETVLWLVGGVPLLASMLGLVLGQYIRHRARAREMAAVPPPEPERPALLDAGDNEPFHTFQGRPSGSAPAKIDVGDHDRWTRRGKITVSAAIAGGGSGLEH